MQTSGMQTLHGNIPPHHVDPQNFLKEPMSAFFDLKISVVQLK